MSVVAYIPIYKVRIDYFVRQGRAWSAFEHLVLWKLAHEPNTASSLAELAGVPLRLAVESIIELIRAGLVTVNTNGDEVSFEATERGKRVASLDRLPENTKQLKRNTALCMDRLTGSFFEPSDLTLVHRDYLPTGAVAIAPRLSKLVTSPEGAIDRLYVEEDETFEAWNDSRVTSNRYFAVVTIAGSAFEGLPIYTASALKETILREVSSSGILKESADVEAAAVAAEYRFEPADGYTSAHVQPADIVVGGQAHYSAITGMLQRAKTFALIHTCFVSSGAVQRLLPFMEEAASRGVQVDLLWGQRNEILSEKSRADFAKAKAILENLSGRSKTNIRFAERETGSHAKIIISDSGPEGANEVCVGSCNWLSSLYKAVEVSIKISEPRIVGTIAGALATLRIHPSARWDADVYRLTALRDKCLKAPQCENGTHNVTVVRDREHLAAVREARDTARSEILAVCDLFGPAGETSVFIPSQEASRSGVRVKLIHNNLAKTMSQQESDGYEQRLASNGIELTEVKNIHAKFMTWDDSAVLITSFNWLATTPDPWKPRGAEIGLLIRGPDLAADLKRRFAEAADVSL